jgi:hypothetical protein
VCVEKPLVGHDTGDSKALLCPLSDKHITQLQDSDLEGLVRFIFVSGEKEKNKKDEQD